MKTIALVILPRMMRPDVAEDYVSAEVLRRALAAGLIKAKVQKKGLTLYDRHDLDRACDRVESLFP